MTIPVEPMTSAGAQPATSASATPRPRRKHPSHGARVVALVGSVVATVGVSAAMAHADIAAAGAGSVASSTSSGSASAPSTTSAQPGSAAAAGAYADGAYTGASEWTKWGNYQVQVTIQNGRIIAVKETESPVDRKSVAINGRAQPVLESEAVAAQSAKIDAVSGATYTSATYKASLQSALDQAAAAARTASATA